jgi:adenosylcobinamide-phosphate synthase
LTLPARERIVRGVTAALYPGLLALGCAVLMDAQIRLASALHPVAWFGKLAERVVARAPLAGALRAGSCGLMLALGLPALAVLCAAGALLVCAHIHAGLAFGAQVFLVYACVCLYGLLDAGEKLALALREPGLDAARERLRWLCSRDPSALDEAGLVNGAVESLAENLSDSVVAPLFFLACFGLPGAVAYRAINTLDAMIGYRGRYEWLGKAAARLDDLANLVPARLSVLFLLAAGSGGRSERQRFSAALRVWSSDHARTESPNAGHPMAMAAGLLGVRLDKPGHYTLGAELPAPTRADLARGIVLVRRAGLLAIATAGLALFLRGGWLG